VGSVKVAFIVIVKRDSKPCEVHPFTIDELADAERIYANAISQHEYRESGIVFSCRECGGDADAPAHKGHVSEAYLLTVARGPLDSTMIVCPGCWVELTPENAGGYRMFCEKCVAVMPPIPGDDSYEIEGSFPNFRWVKSEPGQIGTRAVKAIKPDSKIPF